MRSKQVLFIVFLFAVLVLSLISCSSSGSRSNGNSDDESKKSQSASGNSAFSTEKLKLGQAKATQWFAPEKLRPRGEYLVKSIAACARCHGGESVDGLVSLSGGKIITDSFGPVVAPNITTDRETGIGTWRVPEIVRAIRASIGKDNRPLSLDAHSGFRWMSDADARAIANYLQTTSPEKKAIARRELTLFERKAWGLIPRHQEFTGYIPDYEPGVDARYGKYLSEHVAQCQTCHHSTGGIFSGKKAFYQGDIAESDLPAYPPLAPDIRGGAEGALSKWSEDDFVAYLLGSANNNSSRKNVYCPLPFFKHMSADDARAIAKFLKSLD